MKISRRLFFNRVAGAVAAGPLAVDAVRKEVESKGLAPCSEYSDFCFDVSPQGVDSKSYLENQLKKLWNNPPEPKFNYVNRLDPDLVANRSMSLSTRIRIQAQRNALAAFKNEEKNIIRMIKEIYEKEKG